MLSRTTASVGVSLSNAEPLLFSPIVWIKVKCCFLIDVGTFVCHHRVKANDLVMIRPTTEIECEHLVLPQCMQIIVNIGPVC